MASLRILWKTKFDLQKNDKDEDGNNNDKEEGEKTTTTTFSMEEVRGIRSELVRLVNLSHGIAVRYLYEGISNVYDGHLLASGLLKEEERDFILLPKNSALCGSEYVIPLAWFQDYIGNLVLRKHFDSMNGQSKSLVVVYLIYSGHMMILFVSRQSLCR